MTTLRFDAAFPPAFARFGSTLCTTRPDAVPLTVLLQPAALAGITQRFAGSFPLGSDGRAVLSMWSQYYLLALIPAAVAAALVWKRDLPVAVADMGAVLAPSGQPECLSLPHEGRAAHDACPVGRLAPLLREHLEPFAAALDAAGLPARVVWSNAGHVLLWTLGVVDATDAERIAVRTAATMPCWADGGSNPLAAAIRPATMTRRVCCLRDRLGMPACSSCPRRNLNTTRL